MKTDDYYSAIYTCPTTKSEVSKDKHSCNNGVCHICGHMSDMSFTHAEKTVIRYIRPSFTERWFKGKKKSFITKEEEDKTWETLRKE